MIELITGNKNKIEESLRRIFISFDPFKPEIKNAKLLTLILFPTDGYHLTEKQYSSLIQTISAVGNAEFYISETEWEPDPFSKGHHWYCNNPTFEEYSEILIGVENAIYSIEGKWGILISHELHALMFSDAQFVKLFESEYLNSRKDKEEFLRNWRAIKKSGVKTDWLDGLVKILHN